jgi:hypothetical protein
VKVESFERIERLSERIVANARLDRREGRAHAITPADAAASRQKQYERPHQDLAAPVGVRRPRAPPWAMPNECYIDEGFGRFPPCRR